MPRANVDLRTVESFGREWEHYDQSALPEAEFRERFAEYFAIFPWDTLPEDAKGFDIGCGTGRWARGVAPRVGTLFCIDPSERALAVARRTLRPFDNCRFAVATADDMPIDDESMDFGYSLGVLHHLPEPGRAMANCARKLKHGAPFLVYLYYAFDNRPVWFRYMWKLQDRVRRVVFRLPQRAKLVVSDLIATTVYWPLARVARLLERAGFDLPAYPLWYYRDRSFYTMRTDALDRFGTPLEHRFTRAEIKRMMHDAGLHDVRFSDRAPYWCAVGLRR